MRFVKQQIAVVGLLALVLGLAACGLDVGQQVPPVPTPTPTPGPGEPISGDTPTVATQATPTIWGNVVTGEAVVETVELLMLESFPVQVHVIAKGYLPDPCTMISNVEQSRTGSTFNVKISTVRPADKVCVEVLEPFEQNIPLDVHGLKAATYTVNVNGVTETFELLHLRPPHLLATGILLLQRLII